MKRSPSFRRLVLVLCAVVIALTAMAAQMAVLSELPTIATSLQGGAHRIWERTHGTLAWLASAMKSIGLDAPSEQAHAQATSVQIESLPEHAVQAAWERAQQAGAYRFTADIKQTVVPRPTILNVGRTSKKEALHTEGEANLHEQQLHLTLWSQGGSVVDASSGVGIKVDGDRAYARQGVRDWQEISNFTGLFAPQGDFLAAAKNVKRDDVEPESTDPRFTFHV